MVIITICSNIDTKFKHLYNTRKLPDFISEYHSISQKLTAYQQQQQQQ